MKQAPDLRHLNNRDLEPRGSFCAASTITGSREEKNLGHTWQRFWGAEVRDYPEVRAMIGSSNNERVR